MNDKVQHLIAGFAIGVVGTILAHIWVGTSASFFIGTILASLVGLLKECIDEATKRGWIPKFWIFKGSGFNHEDLQVTVIGGLLGAGIVVLFLPQMHTYGECVGEME
jgi:hypothetical protein